MKERLGHGSFTPWIEAELQWSIRTAQNYMRAAERFGSQAQLVSHLPLSTVYRLASPSTPPTIVEEVIAHSEAGTPLPARAVEDRLTRARHERQEEARLAKMTEKQRRQRERAKARKERETEDWRAKYEAENAKRMTATERASTLIADHLGDRVPEFLELMDETWWPEVRAALIEREKSEPDAMTVHRSGRPMATVT